MGRFKKGNCYFIMIVFLRPSFMAGCRDAEYTTETSLHGAVRWEASPHMKKPLCTVLV